jgi:hypothetical protein
MQSFYEYKFAEYNLTLQKNMNCFTLTNYILRTIFCSRQITVVNAILKQKQSRNRTMRKVALFCGPCFAGHRHKNYRAAMPSRVGSKVFNLATGATGDCKTHTRGPSIEKLGDFALEISDGADSD